VLLCGGQTFLMHLLDKCLYPIKGRLPVTPVPDIIPEHHVTKLFAAAQIPEVAIARQRKTVWIKTDTGAFHQKFVNLGAGGIHVDHFFAEAVCVDLAVDAYEHPFIRLHYGPPFITGMTGMMGMVL
jgi:hypothetical protein